PLGLLFLPRGRRSPRRGAWGRARARGSLPDPDCFPAMLRKDGRLPTAREPDSRAHAGDVARHFIEGRDAHTRRAHIYHGAGGMSLQMLNVARLLSDFSK